MLHPWLCLAWTRKSCTRILWKPKNRSKFWETGSAYADDIVLLGNTQKKVIHSLSKLKEASKNIGLCIDKEKTKLMILSRRNADQSNLIVGSMSLKKIHSFTHLGVNINSSNNVHREIKERISNGNKCYFSIKS